jgi:hypothetical protein
VGPATTCCPSLLRRSGTIRPLLERLRQFYGQRRKMLCRYIDTLAASSEATHNVLRKSHERITILILLKIPAKFEKFKYLTAISSKFLN